MAPCGAHGMVLSAPDEEAVADDENVHLTPQVAELFAAAISQPYACKAPIEPRCSPSARASGIVALSAVLIYTR